MKVLTRKMVGVATALLIVLLLITSCQAAPTEQVVPTETAAPTQTAAPTETATPAPPPEPIEPFIVRVTVAAGEQSAQTEVLVAEGEAKCPIIDFQEGDSIPVWDPELEQNVDRAFVIQCVLDCPEPYIGGHVIAIQDGWYDKYDEYMWTALEELITDEGGVWKGTCVSYMRFQAGECLMDGDGLYKGLQISTRYDYQTSVIKYRVTKLADQ
jgi:hypothetical protein